MKKYDKIETIFQRDINGSKKLIEGAYCSETIRFLSNLEWVWTEKVDGTNIRVHWDGHKVTFGGRTDNAAIPTELVTKLIDIFSSEESAQIFEQLFGEKEVILFGEGYGRKIQNGGSYIKDGVDFILFDVLIGENYQSREFLEKIATAFGIKIVPVVGRGTLEEAVSFVKGKPQSTMGTCIMEGVVARPAIELRDRCHNRIIVKIKWKDFI